MTARSNGFTYLALLFTITLIGIALAGTGVVWHQKIQREKEEELLFVGEQFQQAIASYYNKTPIGQNPYPQSLKDLLLDHRFPFMQRHLRKIYIDPMTGKTNWGLLKDPTGGIMGIYSRSDTKPIRTVFRSKDKITVFDPSHYSGWHFIYLPPVAIK